MASVEQCGCCLHFFRADDRTYIVCERVVKPVLAVSWARIPGTDLVEFYLCWDCYRAVTVVRRP